MQFIPILVLIISLLTESILLDYPLTFIVISSMSVFMGYRLALIAFLTGVLLDLMKMRLIGIDSLFFLLTIFIASRYRRKLNTGNMFFPLTFVTLVTYIYNYFFYKSFDLPRLIIIPVLSGVFIKIFDGIYWLSHKKLSV